MTEHVHHAPRALPPDDASLLVGTLVDRPMDPSFKSPRDGDHVRVLDGRGQTLALVTRLTPEHRARLRDLVTGMRFGQDVGRIGRGMSQVGAVFGYSPPKVMARLEGCRSTTFGRDHPEGQQLLTEIADQLAADFAELMPDQAAHDHDTIDASVLTDWRMGESSWTSGVINQANLLPYHRDGNNLDTWSAMPTIRLGMDGGRLHLPEYDLVLPCGDGDVTWFYGKGLVHGVTPMTRRRPDAYRYSLVFYALKGMVNCATYAEETKRAHARRTARERAETDRIRDKLALPPA
jgi:hypothetical protein